MKQRKRKQRVYIWVAIPLALVLGIGAILFSMAGRTKPVPEMKASPTATQPRNAYVLDLQYDPQTHKVAGSVRIRITNTSTQPWESLCLADWASADTFTQAPAGGLTHIANATLTHQRSDVAVTLLRDEENPCKLTLPLASALLPGEDIHLSFDMTVSVPENSDSFGYGNGVCRLGNFLPQLAYWNGADWVVHPHSDFSESALSTCADYQMTLRAPEDVTVICTGESETRDGVTQAHAENVRDFAMVIGKGWHRVQKQYDDTLVCCYYKGSPLMGRKALAAGCDALGAFGSAIGAYPYPTLDIVSAELDVGGMEYPQLVMIQQKDFAFSSKLFQIAEQNFFRRLIAHEVAHQWFYGVVGSDPYRSPWLDESFAYYLEYVYAAYVGIPASMMSLDISYPLDSSLDVLNTSYLLQGTVYWGGAAFLNEMQEILGEDIFFAALGTIYQQFGYQEIDTQSALQVFRAAASGAKAAQVEALIEKCFTVDNP